MHQYDEARFRAFTDLSGRLIEVHVLDDWPPRVVALHAGQEIGRLEFRPWGGMDDDDGLMLSHADVKSSFQRAGIGTAMMSAATSVLGFFQVPGRSWQGGSEGRRDARSPR